MTIEIALFIAAVLVLVGVWLAWKIVRGRIREDDKPSPKALAPAPEPAPVAEPARKVETPVASVPVAAPVPVATPAPVAAPRPPPPPPPTSRPPPPPPPELDMPVPVTVIMAPRPPAQVIERVLALEPASQGEWDAAMPMALSAVQSATIVASLAAGGNPAFHAIAFQAGTAISVGRGDLGFMRVLASKSETVASGSGRWLDSSAATALAATALAGLAKERFLEALGDEVRELKAEIAALSPKVAALGDPRLKTLVQDLSRFAREAHDNYASALGKLAFRERVDESGERALSIWRELVEKADAMRQQLDAMTKLQRFGEAQVEKALAQMRDLNDLERWQRIAARSLAAAHVLRIVMGEMPPRNGSDPLTSAAAALQAGLDQDRDLALHLSDCEKAARGDPYVGKAEFEANRAALRKLLSRPLAEQVAPALERLEAAREADALDPVGAAPRRLLIRASAETCTMRWGAAAS